jgi:glycosyltransferase involved in cell wall biosynthesis
MTRETSAIGISEQPQPARVLITGGHEVGGLESFARALLRGFSLLGIPGEVIPPSAAVSRLRDLRDPRVLKILSTTAVFSAPLARRAICIAHGIPCAAYQGWPTFAGNIVSYRLSNFCPGTQLVAVSAYTALHLNALFGISIARVILNPVKEVYLDTFQPESADRGYVTFVGRLVTAKNLHRLILPVRQLLDENPGLRMAIIGNGPQKPVLMEMVRGDSRFEFMCNLDDLTVRGFLRRTKIFISGHGAEGLGITYLEALSQGCAVAMPASGGGVELGLDHLGSRVHLLPLSFHPSEVLPVLRRALSAPCVPMSMDAYTPQAVASQYLAVDAQFSLAGRRSPRLTGDWMASA